MTSSVSERLRGARVGYFGKICGIPGKFSEKDLSIWRIPLA